MNKQNLNEAQKTAQKNEVAESNTLAVDKVKELQELLNAQILKSKELSEKIELREKFITTQKQLTSVFNKTKREAEDIFDDKSNHCVIDFCDPEQYRSEPFLKIKNPFLISEMVDFVLVKINERIAALEAEILS